MIFKDEDLIPILDAYKQFGATCTFFGWPLMDALNQYFVERYKGKQENNVLSFAEQILERKTGTAKADWEPGEWTNTIDAMVTYADYWKEPTSTQAPSTVVVDYLMFRGDIEKTDAKLNELIRVVNELSAKAGLTNLP